MCIFLGGVSVSFCRNLRRNSTGERGFAWRKLRRRYSTIIVIANPIWFAVFFSRGNSSVMGLISDPLLFAIALIDTGSVLFLLVYYVSFIISLNVSNINLFYISLNWGQSNRLNIWIKNVLFSFLLKVIFLLATMQWRRFQVSFRR